MLIDCRMLSGSETFSADVCIIGAGVAGIILAKELSDSGKNVILVESGGENFDSQIQSLYEAEQYPEQFPNPHYSRFRFLGGSSNCWENNTSPFSPIDFEARDWVPNSGWPISYSEVDQYYSRAASYCGVIDDSYDTAYWSKRLGVRDNFVNSKSIETAIGKSAKIPVRFFPKYGNSLVNSDSVKLLTHLNLINVDFNSSSGSIESAEFRVLNGDKHIVSAACFVLCLGGIENARLLLELNEKHDNQLGNQGDSVGRYFMEHPTVRAAHLFVSKDFIGDFYKYHEVGDAKVGGFLQIREDKLKKHKTTNLRMPLISASNYDLSDGIASYHVVNESVKRSEWPDDFGSHIYNLLTDMDMVIEAVARKKFNKRIFSSASEVGGFQIISMTEQSPVRENRIKLGEQRDALGLKKIAIEWKVTQHDKNNVWKSLELAAQEFGALGLGRLRILREHESHVWGSQLGFGQHHMGATRMAKSPDEGVVDSNLKVFGCNNLYVSGCSVFTTGSHVPPTLTIAALSIRLSEHLKEVI